MGETVLEQQSIVGEDEAELDEEVELEEEGWGETPVGVRRACGGRRLRFINVASFCSCCE